MTGNLDMGNNQPIINAGSITSVGTITGTTVNTNDLAVNGLVVTNLIMGSNNINTTGQVNTTNLAVNGQVVTNLDMGSNNIVSSQQLLHGSNFTSLPTGIKDVYCPAGYAVVGLKYEGATWSSNMDSHAGPEITGVHCARVGFQ
jgi:hypothetical protein